MPKDNNLEIKVTDILDLEEHNKYKLHAAVRARDGARPLDAFLADYWKGWNQYRGDRNDFNRDYIFSMMEFHPVPNTWLFGGIFKVMERKEDSYVVEELEKYKKFTGRLLLYFEHKDRARRLCLENYIDNISVNKIFEYRFTGKLFPGFDNINDDFIELESVFKTNKSDWKTALESVKGVYLLTDKETGKFYIGSAYSEGGIWSRWSEYINTFHGGNDKMKSLVSEKGENYIRNNFKFSILEIHKKDVTDEQIRKRETYWKEKLMTKIHGYNSN